MRILILLAFGLWAAPVLAWEPMDIQDLNGATVRYANAVQTFEASGKTVYTTTRPSEGQWREQGGKYCSIWPPGNVWACFALEREGNKIRFLGEDGSVTDGVLE